MIRANIEASPSRTSTRVSAVAFASAIPCSTSTAQSSITTRSCRPVRPVAASSGSTHSRYHGCTTGPSATAASSTSAAPRTGERPCGRRTRESAMAAPISIPAARKKLTAPSTVPRPRSSPGRCPRSCPVRWSGTARSGPCPGVLSDATQPRPTPTTRESTAKTTSTIASDSAHAQIRWVQVAPVPAQIRPAKGSTDQGDGLHCAGHADQDDAHHGMALTASARPATISPTMSASSGAPSEEVQSGAGGSAG